MIRGVAFLNLFIKNVLKASGIPFISQKSIGLEYKGTRLKHIYQPDFICYEKIILGIKAVDGLVDEHRAQLLNYLKATRFKVGLLVNFGHYPKLEYERVVL